MLRVVITFRKLFPRRFGIPFRIVLKGGEHYFFLKMISVGYYTFDTILWKFQKTDHRNALDRYCNNRIRSQWSVERSRAGQIVDSWFYIFVDRVIKTFAPISCAVVHWTDCADSTATACATLISTSTFDSTTSDTAWTADPELTILRIKMQGTGILF